MTTMPPPMPTAACCGTTRRQLLHGTGVAACAFAGTALLGACAQETRDPGAGADAVSSAGAGTVLVALDEVPVGGAASVTVKGQPVLVTQPAEGEVRAFSAICTHQGCTVMPADGELECPCHRSRFALADGAVLGGPASEPLAEVSVTVVDGDVVVA